MVDWWALGILLYRIINKGHAPYKGTTKETIMNNIETKGLKKLDKE